MKRYTYRFVWRDTSTKKFVRTFIEAASQEDAIAVFEAEHKITVDHDKVKVFRTHI